MVYEVEWNTNELSVSEFKKGDILIYKNDYEIYEFLKDTNNVYVYDNNDRKNLGYGTIIANTKIARRMYSDRIIAEKGEYLLVAKK